MTHAIIHRVVRTSLSLLILGAAGTPPILTAALPGSAFARLPPQESRPLTDFDTGPLWQYLSTTGVHPAPEAQELLGLTDLPGLAPERPFPRTFIEELAAEIEGRELCVPRSMSRSSLDIDGDIGRPQTRLVPTWSNVWSDGAPLLLIRLPSGSSDPLPGRGLGYDGMKRVATAKSEAEWATLSSKVTLRDRDPLLDPADRHTWETDETLRLPVAGSLFLFGQLGASRPDAEQRQMKWLGKTGVGVKLKPWLLQEVQVRGGPAVRYDDTGTLSAGQSPERSELFLEAVTKLPLPVVGPLNVEYTSYAVPPATAADHSHVDQDFKLALPLSSGGQFHIGAKYKWENTPSATPWVDRMELYLGLQLKR
jgi:hypothetical protein